MPRIAYESWAPKGESLATIRWVRDVCEDYAAQGYDLTLRQLYYQGVARGYIPNSQQSYKRLGDTVNKARLAGYLDWDYIVDRTRNLESVGHWSSPGSVVRAAAEAFRLDKWATQPTRVEVWVEKEALAGVVEGAAHRADVAYFSCRGYVSQSEMWRAARRHLGYVKGGQNVVVLHLGDHDPSGIDMTRDIDQRLTGFLLQDWLNHVGAAACGATAGQTSVTHGAIRDSANRHIRESWEARGVEGLPFHWPIEVRRIALNMDQVEEYDPPPNPAKLTDARAEGYVERFGYESWELDALDPATLDALISDTINGIVDEEAYSNLEVEERGHRALLTLAGERWEEVVDMLEDDTDYGQPLVVPDEVEEDEEDEEDED